MASPRPCARIRSRFRIGGYGGYGGYGYGGFGGYYSLPPDDSGYLPPSSAPAGVGECGPLVPYPPQGTAYTETAHSGDPRLYTTGRLWQTRRDPTTGPILYLIAFRDNTIRAAMTYWVDNGTLHYLDTSHKEKQAPLSSVDRDMSAQLNRERHIPFNVQ